jgi:hypothetical protein
VATLRSTAEREAARENDLRLEMIGESARAQREGRPDHGRAAREFALREQVRIRIAAEQILLDAQRALSRLIDRAHVRPKKNGSRKSGRRSGR